MECGVWAWTGAPGSRGQRPFHRTGRAALTGPCSHHPHLSHSPARTPGWMFPEPPGPAGTGSPSVRWQPTGRTGWPTVHEQGRTAGGQGCPGPTPFPHPCTLQTSPAPTVRVTFSFCLVSSEMLPFGESRVGVGGVTVISGGNLVAAEGMTSFGMLGKRRALARHGSVLFVWPSGGWVFPLLGTLEQAAVWGETSRE